MGGVRTSPIKKRNYHTKKKRHIREQNLKKEKKKEVRKLTRAPPNRPGTYSDVKKTGKWETFL